MKKVLLTFLFFITFSLNAADLHLLLVIDREAAKIDQSVVTDGELIVAKMKEAARYTGLDYRETRWQGEALTAINVLNFLKTVPIGPDDAIVFYFGGHGFRTAKKQDPWPNLYLTASNTFLDFSVVSKTLADRKPRFLLSMADCCNNVISWKTAEASCLIAMGRTEKNRQNRYQELFLHSNAYIMVSSSSPGEYSQAYLTKGSVFTIEFLNALDRELKGKDIADWEVVLETTKQNALRITEEAACEPQTAQYLIF